MVGAEYQVLAFIDQTAFFLRRSTPEHKNDAPGTGRYLRDQGVRQNFPTFSLVAVGQAFLHRQAGIEEQSALLRPCNKAAAGHRHDGPGFAQVALAFFENIAQGRRQRVAWCDRKGQALGLAYLFQLPVGDGILLMVLAASASYIAVPAVLRYALPEASPSLYFGLSLGITFPLNLIVGIPFYAAVAQKVLH